MMKLIQKYSHFPVVIGNNDAWIYNNYVMHIYTSFGSGVAGFI